MCPYKNKKEKEIDSMPSQYNVKRDTMIKLIRQRKRISVSKLAVLMNIAPQTIKLNYKNVILDLCEDIHYNDTEKQFYIESVETENEKVLREMQ